MRPETVGWWRYERDEAQPDGDCAEAVRLHELGELDATEVARVRERAEDALRNIEWERHLERVGAVTTSPASARESMRERRDRDAAAWREVLGALDD